MENTTIPNPVEQTFDVDAFMDLIKQHKEIFRNLNNVSIMLRITSDDADIAIMRAEKPLFGKRIKL